jgi:hypothetical protein
MKNKYNRIKSRHALGSLETAQVFKIENYNTHTLVHNIEHQ